MDEVRRLTQLYYAALQAIVGAIEADESWTMSREQAAFCDNASKEIKNAYDSLNEANKRVVDARFNEISEPRGALPTYSDNSVAIRARDTLEALNALTP